MSQESKLLKEVVNNPLQLEPRLVLADWYQENGNPRGDLIRTQCQMDGMHWADEGYSDFEDLEAQLLKKHRTVWLKELPKWKNVTWGNYEDVFNEDTWDLGRRYFRRGFVESVSIRDLKTFRANLPKLKKSVVRFISLTDANTRGSYELLKKFPNLQGLSIPYYYPELNSEWLGELPQLENLEALAINGHGIGESGKDEHELINLRMPKLRSLDLSSNSLGSLPAMKRFLKWESLDGLRWLNLGLNDLAGKDQPNPKIITALAKEKKLKDLSSLNLWGNHLGDSFIEALAKNAKMKNLVELSLSGTHPLYEKLSSTGISALLNKFRKLRFLKLSNSSLDNSAIKAIAENKWSNSLKHLNIGHNEKVSAPAISAIAKSENMQNLTHLNLAGTKLDERGAKALIASKTLNSICHLNIGKPEISPASIKALQKRFPKAIVKKPYH